MIVRIMPWNNSRLRRYLIISKRQLLLVPFLLALGLLCFHILIVRDLTDWSPLSNRHAESYIKPHLETVLVFPSTRILARGEEVDVLGVIHSSPNHFENRDVIRKTWLKDLKKMNGSSFKVVFLLGTKEMDSHSKSLLSSEIDSFGDIVVEDFMDTYNNLTLKSIFMLKFIVRYNLKIKTLFKMDDDSYFNVERFPTIIDFDSTAIRGFKYVQTYPIRYATIFTVASKWICPSWMYVDDIYPEYIGGAGYLIPGSEIPKLYKSSFTTLFIHLEDVFLTGIIAKLNSVPRENIPSFLDKTGSTCPKDITMLLFHPINPSKMKVIHQLIKEGDNTHCQWH
ncbi:beta-1,3-galactosyltransferase 1 [Lepeophtheirus salmonis]|uniref:beta-1,3-galactosyltransferase 1 n=1 Tax=Lepeophtheirus salmonis TaxID=72036 RepID=UPI00077ED072|nr:beta-1,3-galactosyltransferase 1-like [Lepeophtheirus salmonis]XP_040563572.1 beta-1,3-galactosyltransferase 1-like [Lepeophtheirus salmonis]